MDHADSDASRRALREAQIEAQRLIEAVQSALREDASLLNEPERNQLESLILRLQTVTIGDDRAAIHSAMDALNNGSEIFAARRMNKHIAHALRGQHVYSLDRDHQIKGSST